MLLFEKASTHNPPPTAHALGHPIQPFIQGTALDHLHRFCWYAHAFCVVPHLPFLPFLAPFWRPTSCFLGCWLLMPAPSPLLDSLLHSWFAVPLPFAAAALASVPLFNCAAFLYVYHLLLASPFLHFWQCKKIYKFLKDFGIFSCQVFNLTLHSVYIVR